MTSHPYISGAGNVAQIIGFLRKNFPAIVNADTVRKLGIAPRNESYVINALQFIGVIDQESKRTDRGQDVLATHDEEEFKRAFAGLIKDSYKDLFDLRGDDAWTMDRDALVGYFRKADKTSEVIGVRQAGLFQAFRAMAGQDAGTAKNSGTPRLEKVLNSKVKRARAPIRVSTPNQSLVLPSKRDMALTVRIEINLPTEASAETYDNIFKSIKANLLND